MTAALVQQVSTNYRDALDVLFEDLNLSYLLNIRYQRMVSTPTEPGLPKIYERFLDAWHSEHKRVIACLSREAISFGRQATRSTSAFSTSATSPSFWNWKLVNIQHVFDHLVLPREAVVATPVVARMLAVM